MAEGLAAAGADVAVVSRKLAACEAAAGEISRSTGRKAVGLACHVGHWSECDALVDAVYGVFGRCDVLVNNAGMSPLYPDLPSVTEELYDKTFAVNAKGPFRLSSLVGTRMAGHDGGSIINVTTAGSLRPEAGHLPYAMAKAGLNALTLGLAGVGPEGPGQPGAAGRVRHRGHRCLAPGLRSRRRQPTPWGGSACRRIWWAPACSWPAMPPPT